MTDSLFNQDHHHMMTALASGLKDKAAKHQLRLAMKVPTSAHLVCTVHLIVLMLNRHQRIFFLLQTPEQRALNVFFWDSSFSFSVDLDYLLLYLQESQL